MLVEASEQQEKTCYWYSNVKDTQDENVMTKKVKELKIYKGFG